MRHRHYHLRSVWSVDARADDVWAVLADPAMSWPRWWPGVRAERVEPREQLVGSRAEVTFRARVGYGLRLRLLVTRATPPHAVTIATAGDLVGTADVTLRPDADRTSVTIVWDVVTTLAWMNAVGPLLARPFAASHAAVMRAGERGLAAELRRARPAS
ncbi:SRPBCC family protein [Cellulomonas sp. HZM]|uniref:SRPBCC family protein n=1 Tax=Cellulomonas sp. HZM TaxID=1454010 RepID=UPI00054FDDE4|nr:SRPBCC family protein [Cellulomonas sp. HZM]